MNTKFDPTDRKALLKHALAAVDEMQAKLEASERSRNEPIAIVGLACRYPGAERPEDLWRVLRNGIDAVSDVPADRWDAEKFYDPDPAVPGKMVTCRGGFLPRVDLFDPQFFGISPREASSMDPQQRLLLEATWEALETAGQAPDALVGSQTGVFVGITTNDYSHLVGVGSADQCDVYAATGNALNAAAGRLAFVLGLQGPCVAVDTACSSSLVAIHLACQSLRAGDSSMAVAGGVNIVLRPEAAILFSKWGMLAPDGRCKTFDAAADGFVRGEGCGIVVLKRLADAVANGDNVLAIIRGSATNQDGRSSGLTVPSGPAQQAVVRRALATAGIDPSAVDYVETHGTGTPIGDPIEVEALAAEFGKGRPAGKPLLIGSIKTNIGHTEAASGVAGLIKVVLALQHQEIPPHLHLQQLNPRIAWDRLPLAVPTELTPWPRGDRRRIAGVSSFGFSGTNAHIVIEEGPIAASSADGVRPRHLLALSARSRPALAQLAGRMASHLASHAEVSLGDVCFTAATGRAQFPHRIALQVSSREELVNSLRGFAEGRDGIRLSGEARRAGAAKVAFLFTGQGSQYAGMARGLYETHATFRTAIDRCEELLRPLTDRPLTSVLFPSPQNGADGSIDATAWTQPALFAVEYALASLWREWGIEPAVVMGHSLGEDVAAAVAGVFTLEEALTLVAARGRLMQAMPAGGAMAAVFAPEARVADALRSHERLVAIAAVNAPEEIVISGDGDAVKALCLSFGEAGIKTKPLTVSHAFHSPLMDPMLEEFERIARAIKPRAPRIPLVSNVTGRYVTADEPFDAAYWRRHVRQPVRFLDSVRAVHAKGIEIFLELGPAPVLGGMTRQILESGDLRVFASLRKGRDDWQTMLDALGGLFVEGVPIDWRGFDKPQARRRVVLPTYPFQRERHWIDTRREAGRDERPRADAVLPGVRVRSALNGDVVFQAEVSASSEPFLADHAVFGNVIFPAAGYLGLALAAVGQLEAGHSSEIAGLSLHEALIFPEGEHRLVQTILSPVGDGGYRFGVYSAPSSDQPLAQWTRHASGGVRTVPGSELAQPAAPTLAEAVGRCSTSLDPAAFYTRLEESGIQYGPSYRRVRDLSVGPGEAIGRIATDGAPASMPVHPAVLDAAFQVLGAAWAEQFSTTQSEDTFLPIGIRRLWVSGSLHAGDLRGIARIVDQTAEHRETIAGDVWCFDDKGMLVLAVEGFTAKRATRDALLRSHPGRTDDWLYEVAWRPGATADASPDPLGHWLVFADRSGTGAHLAAAFDRAGAPCTMVRAGSVYGEDADGFTINPNDRGDCARLFAAVNARHGHAPAGVVHLWNLDLDSKDDALSGELFDFGVGSLLNLVQASIDADRARPARMLVVTRGAQPVGGARAPVNPQQAPAWGFARTIVTEHPELACQMVDLEPGSDDASEAGHLFAEIASAAPYEPQVAYRAGTRVSPRLVRSGSADAAGTVVVPATPYELTIPTRGVLDALVLTPATAQPPAAGEVQIRLSSSALNFRDVLNALGMYPGDPGPLGSESAGEVVAVGAGVEGLHVGDRVVAIANRAFSTFVCARAEMVQCIPDGVTDEEAVTIPNAYLTAHYGLVRVGQMKAGDRVLIHAATGGVGLAAVRLARRAGAEVFATAGNPQKRAFLRSIGVAHVMDSRSGAFAQQILDATNGAGVDIVLNSLTGDLIDKSISALSECGRFVEIGKTDLRDAEVIRRQRPGVSYTVLDLGVECRNDPAGVGSVFAELLSAVQSGALPPLPRHMFAISAVRDAFRFMAQAKHVGKIVVRHTPAPGVFVSDATYLVTGGVGGLGLTVARWMVDHGARHLTLVGRSGASAEAQLAIASLEQAGATVTVARADVASREQLADIFSRIPHALPLRGIVHAAGSLDDGVVRQLTRERLERVMAPKVQGAWNLHQLSRTAALDFFVLFSSGSALFGSPGQANYAAGNAFLDALSQYRRVLHLPGISINWGAWSDVGMAARLDRRDRDRISATGISPIDPARGIDALGEVMRRDRAQMVVLPVNWTAFARQFAGRGVPSFVAELASTASRSTASPVAGAPTDDLLLRLVACDPEGRARLAQTYVASQIESVLGVNNAELDHGEPITMLGLDSLMAVELKNRFEADLGVVVPVVRLLQGPSVRDLAEMLVSGVGTDRAAEAALPVAASVEEGEF